MKDNNLDDLIIDSLKTDKGGNKNILSIVILFGIILLIAILLTKIMIDKPQISPTDDNKTELANNDLVMDINGTFDENESNSTAQAGLKDANQSTVPKKQLQANQSEPAKIVVVVKTEDSQNEVKKVDSEQEAPKVEQQIERKREVPKVVYVREPQKTVVKQEAPRIVYVKETPRSEPAKEVVKREIPKVVYIREAQKADKKAEYGLEDPGYEKTSEAKREALKREIKKIEYTREAPKVEKKYEPAREVVKKETATATFYIQAGAFGNIDNAAKVEDSIRGVGLEPKLLHKANVAKILVGPFSSQAKAEAALSKVRARVNKDAFIVKQ